MAKASPLSNLNWERVVNSMNGSEMDFSGGLNARGEEFPAPPPTSRSDIELRKAGLTDTPKSEYTGGMTR